MILLFDIGNTHTHLGLADRRRVLKQTNIPTASWVNGHAEKFVGKFVGRATLEGAALCSVVPDTTPAVRGLLRRRWRLNCLELGPATVTGVACR